MYIETIDETNQVSKMIKATQEIFKFVAQKKIGKENKEMAVIACYK